MASRFFRQSVNKYSWLRCTDIAYSHCSVFCRRYVSNKQFFERLVDGAKKDENTRWAVGGNAPVMAKRLAMEGSEILLGARQSPNVVFGEHIKGEAISVIGFAQLIFDTVHQSTCEHVWPQLLCKVGVGCSRLIGVI